MENTTIARATEKMTEGVHETIDLTLQQLEELANLEPIESASYSPGD